MRTSIALGQAALERNRAFNRVDDARKFGEQPIAHEFEDAAMVTLYLGFERLLASRLQARKCPRLVALMSAE